MPLTLDSLRLFGSFQLICRGKEIALVQPRLEELIALLAIHAGQPVTRIQIAHQLWPDSNEKQARANVRNILYRLKRAWPNRDEAIAIEGKHLTWRRDTTFQVDVQQFEEKSALERRSQNADERIRLLAEAADCYQGDLLPDSFADWALAERERLRGDYVTVLERLVDALLDQRRYEEALQHAKALQRLDPLHEFAYRHLMRIYAALGDRAAALRVYHTCASTLQQELGVEPSPATEALRTRLLDLEAQATLPDAPDMPQAVQRQRLIGRHDECRQLQNAWRHVQHGAAKCILIWGEAGIGKTRLAEELLDWAQHQSQTTASSRSYAVEGALTYAPIAEWLRAPTIRPALEHVDDLWWVEIARLLPELLADRPDLPQPGPMTETWQQQRFFQSIVHALKAAPAPLLLHLDDLQWSDEETLTLLQFLLHGARAHPLLFVGGIRSEDAGGNQALAAFIEAMRHSGQIIELFLGPLSANEAEQLAIQTAGKAIDSDVTNALFTASEGHPLYVIEAIRSEQVTLLSTSAKPATPGSESHRTSAMPDRIYNLLSTRLGQLSPTGLQVASLAAVIGHAFSYDVLRAAASVDEATLIDALDELWSRRIIREQSGDSYDFSHDRIREVAYHEISRARRRFYHREVADALSAIHGESLDSVAGELATHYAQTGDSPAAYRYYRQAASVAIAQHALHDAETMLVEALRHAPDDPVERSKLLYEQNRVFRSLLDFERWQKNLTEMQTLLSSLDESEPRLRLTLLLDRARYFDDIGDGQNGVASAREAIDLAELLGDNHKLALAYWLLASNYWRLGEYRASAEAFEQSAHLARAVADRSLEAKNLTLQARIGLFTDMSADEVQNLLTRSLDLVELIGNREQEADTYGKLGYLHVALGMGDFDIAERELRKAIEIAEEIGDSWQISIRGSALSWLFINKGDYRQATSVLEANGMTEETGKAFFDHWVNVGRWGVLMMEVGCLALAEDRLLDACNVLRQHDVRFFHAHMRYHLGSLYFLKGQYTQAETELSTALDIAEQSGDLRLRASVSTRLGFVGEATQRIDQAAALYSHGCELHHQMGQHYYAMNALAGQARIAALQGEDETALDHVMTIWETIGGKEMDATIETARTLRTCYTIFEAHDDPRADQVLTMALEQLQRRVSTIDDPQHVEQFWQIEDHRFFRRLNKPD